ncbi:DUF1694 domain-containing protein [Virgibacillus dakarensis]|uniref:DUF1694 domain-containing protein n=1 Tax=Lentibacillus populi TaxID=1827502 RepID=A0A9W5X5B0_9BACI|nr:MULTISPECIES: YueI family protein [Bacillaceae]MTW84517.1 DUF1694 domain-containing protein [Virgibacillus dakarensis]GGB42174.1 hypothetical protein GCM10011409_19630 [Lentibacillus populi]
MKKVEDYLNEGIYGVRKPKQAERLKYLGTLRERIVVALSKGQVMADKGLNGLEDAMQKHPDSKLLLNGHIPSRFFEEERKLAKIYNIPYTSITNEDYDSEIGAVLTYDFAIDKETIFVDDDDDSVTERKQDEPKSLLDKIRHWFFPPV